MYIMRKKALIMIREFKVCRLRGNAVRDGGNLWEKIDKFMVNETRK